ncbi:MAG: glycosyltransferase family 2 protein [Sporichthyaceae bacterium]|nr:glycosyltransferase family 2 protein [Sporichthyaceae bacterium]
MTKHARQNGDVAVVIPAKDEQDRIGATVAAARTIPGVNVVIVVDDGSRDDTARVARSVGATVVRHSHNRGKGAAMRTGAAVVSGLDTTDGRTEPRHLLFLDADLEETALAGEALVEPVRHGKADMTIAVLPPQKRPGGGFGFVVRASRDGIRKLTDFDPTQPLSGQRCLTRAAFQAAQPLAYGFGVETGLTIDLVRKGFVVEEIEADFHHRVTGRDLRSQVHRLRQYAHVQAAIATRRLAASGTAATTGAAAHDPDR